jgi:hypothetical protein
MKVPVVPKQKAPVSRFIPKLDQRIGALWLWVPTVRNKRTPATDTETLVEVFATADVAETLRGMKTATSGPRRHATHVAFEPFETVEEAKAYAAEATTLFLTEPEKAAPAESKDTPVVM